MDPCGYKWIDVKMLFYADIAKNKIKKMAKKSWQQVIWLLLSCNIAI